MVNGILKRLLLAVSASWLFAWADEPLKPVQYTPAEVDEAISISSDFAMFIRLGVRKLIAEVNLRQLNDVKYFRFLDKRGKWMNIRNI